MPNGSWAASNSAWRKPGFPRTSLTCMPALAAPDPSPGCGSPWPRSRGSPSERASRSWSCRRWTPTPPNGREPRRLSCRCLTPSGRVSSMPCTWQVRERPARIDEEAPRLLQRVDACAEVLFVGPDVDLLEDLAAERSGFRVAGVQAPVARGIHHRPRSRALRGRGALAFGCSAKLPQGQRRRRDGRRGQGMTMRRDFSELEEVVDLEELGEMQMLEDQSNAAPSASPLLSFSCIRNLMTSYSMRTRSDGNPGRYALLRVQERLV